MRADPSSAPRQRGDGRVGSLLPDGVTAEAVQAQLERILASESFAHAERLRRFLRFTVEQTIQGQALNLKEYVLGVKVFDREESYDPRVDPIVRVEAARLRSKLRDYYETQGCDDPILVGFPKGGYTPVFPKRRSAIPASPPITWLRDWRNLALVSALLVAGVAGLWGVSLTKQTRALQLELEAARRGVPSPEFVPIWGDFLSPGSETFVVFGSPMFFAGGADSGLFLRLGRLNEPAAVAGDSGFQRLQEHLGALSGPRYDYASMGDTIAVQRLTAFLGGAGRKLTALPAHQAAWDTIRDRNIIFLGAPRMIPLLKSLPVERNFEWDSDHNIINRRPHPGEQAIYSTPSHWEKMTYAVIASLPGLRANHEVLLMSAHSAPGSLAAVDYLTRPDTARALSEKLQLSAAGGRKHYELLLRVFVDKGTPVKTEYVTHHLLAATPP